MITFGREITNNKELAMEREWLVTNGIGGYASGTVANVHSRAYHGLLVAALKPPLDRTVLVSKLDESLIYGNETFPLFGNQWGNGGIVVPEGYLQVERFHLEGLIPVWTYVIQDAVVEKRVWMEHGANITYSQYRYAYGTQPLTLDLKALVNYRNFHSRTNGGDWQMDISRHDNSPNNTVPNKNGICVKPFDGATPFYLFCNRGDVTPYHEWYRNYYYAAEARRGLHPNEDNLYAGQFRATLQPGDEMMVVATTEPSPSINGAAALLRRLQYEGQLVVQSKREDEPWWVQHLVQAADQFIVRRSVADERAGNEGIAHESKGNDPDGRSIIAGYHWFGDWGRDTMISLPGLTLATGRYDEAAKILRTFAQHVDQGMLPNRFPDDNEEPEYNTVDATLWYLEAIRAYYAATGDNDLVEELFPILAAIIDWHERGTRYGIKVDPNDGLLSAGEPGVQLTWMDAKVGDWVVTPRSGKAVEINALWYNGLRIMVEFAQLVGQDHGPYQTLAALAEQSFGRFWIEGKGYCYDVIDALEGEQAGGNDDALRPNQLIAVSLPHSPLTSTQQRSMVDLCGRHLLTSMGLRSLAVDHPAYVGQFSGGVYQRDGAYHQGTVWGWLIGPYLSAHYRVFGDKGYILDRLQPLVQHLSDFGVGSISEIAEGDLPHRPRGCMAQAWSVAEVLRVWAQIQEA